MKVICPACQREGRKSKVYSMGSARTMLGWNTYHDEEGVYHSHDPNEVKTGYRCENGHMFDVIWRAECPNCDYGREKPEVKELGVDEKYLARKRRADEKGGEI